MEQFLSAKYLSGRNANQKIGITGSTENEKVLEVVGNVGIGTTVFEPSESLDVRGSVSVADTITASTINATTITITGAGSSVSLDNITVSGVSTFSGNIDANADLDVDGHTELDDVNISGVSTFASDVDINAGLDVDGHTELDDVNISGVTTFVGAADFNGDIDVDGHTELDNVNISGVTTFVGSIDANGDLDVDGVTELDITNISETLNVVGISTFASDVDINAGLDVDGHTELDNLNVSGVSTFASNIDINASIDVDGHAELDQLNVSGVSTFADDVRILTSVKVGSTTTITTFGISAGIITGNLDNNLYLVTTGPGLTGIATYNNSGVTTFTVESNATENNVSGTLVYRNGSGNFSAGTITANLTGTATSATKLETPRYFSISGGIVTASPVSFDGSGDAVLSASIVPNSIVLDTDTTGDYVRTISGTAGEIQVTGGTGEGSEPVIGLTTDVTIAQDLTVSRDVEVLRNLNVIGNLTIGGTTAAITVQEFLVADKEIVLGFTTDASNNEVSNDDTANGGGISIASTVGNPLVDFNIAGIHTHENTYKDIIWIKEGTLGAGTTDAWHFNYAVGIGSTQVPNGIVFAAGSVQFSNQDLSHVRDINSIGIITGTFSESFTVNTSGNGISGSAAYDNSSSTTATITSNATSDNSGDTIVFRDGSGGFSAGIITATLSGTATTATNLADGANITTGTISDARLPDLITSNLNIASGVSSVATLDATNATIDNLTFTSGTAITSVDTDLSSVSTSDDTLASAKAIKSYIDTEVGNVGLAITADTGSTNIDLDTETLTVSGYVNEIETSISGETITVKLPTDVAITTSLTVGTATTITGSSIIVDTVIGTLDNDLTLATSGTGLSGSATYNNSGAATFTVTSNATSTNTPSTIVARNAGGNFSAGTITANLTGTATSAVSLNSGANILTGTISDDRLPDLITSNINVVSGVSTVSQVIVGSAVTIDSSGIDVGSGVTISSSGIINVGSDVTINSSGINAAAGIITALQFVGTATTASFATTAFTLNGVVEENLSVAIAVTATNINGGDAGDIPYQSAANTTTFLDASTASENQVIRWSGSAPVWDYHGISVKNEGSVVGFATQILSIDFTGNNIVATGSGYGATVTLSDSPSFDQLNVTGVSTFGTNVFVGGATTDLVVNGDVRITGILTLGTGSITLDGSSNFLGLGTGSPTGDENSLSLFSRASDPPGAGSFRIAGPLQKIVYNGLDVGLLSGAYSGGVYGLQSTQSNSLVSVGVITALSSLTVGTATTITTSGIVAGIITGTLDNTLTLATSGTGLSGSATYDNSGAATFTVTSNATDANTNSTIVARDGSGNFSAGTITADLSGNASTATYAPTAGVATALQTARDFSITGDFVTATAVSFDGTGNVALAATITADSIELGTYTSGNYVQSISGTTNQVTVTGGTGEGSTPVIGLPNDVTISNDLTVLGDVQISQNLNVSGNITIGGTSATITAETLQVSDADLVLGVRTDAFGNDIATDTTANHGGIAIASTEGSPLVDLTVVGIETLANTYKKIMWFKAGTFTGLGTDAWLSNYAVGIGSTQFPSGTRLAAGSVQVSEYDLSVVRNVNASGIITGTLDNTLTLATSGTGISGSATYNNSGAATFTVTSNATDANTNSTVVARDGSGNFSAGTITANLTGTATTSTNIAGGDAGDIPYQSAANTTTFLDASTAGTGQVLLWSGAAPIWANVNSATGAYGGLTVQDEGVIIGTATSIAALNFVGGNIQAISAGGTAGVATVTFSDTPTFDNLSVTGISTFSSISSLNVTGISTFASDLDINASIDVSGIVTATGGFNIGIQSGGIEVATGVITALNFIGAGNTFLYNAATKTIDISIQGGGGGAGGAARDVTSYTATAGVSTYNVTYTTGNLEVFLNGSRLNSSEFTATNGTSVTLTDGPSEGDVLDLIHYTLGIGDTGPSAGAGGTWTTYTAGIATSKSVGINTSTIDNTNLTGVGNSFQGLYVSNGLIIMDNALNGNHYIGTAYNGLMAGPVTVNGTLTVDGNYVVV